MRRISLALALVGAAAVTGCMSGSKSAGSSDSGAQKGVAGSYYFVNLFQAPTGGYVTSDVGGINCGEGGAGACFSAQIAWGQTVTLTAHPGGSNVFISWAGDCAGAALTCELTAGADKSVAAIFGAAGSGHANFTSAALHGPAYWAWYNAPATAALKCTSCHGPTLLGVGIAPSCASCHVAPPVPGAISGHTDATAEAWGDHGGWSAACQRCHTNQGYLDRIGAVAPGVIGTTAEYKANPYTAAIDQTLATPPLSTGYTPGPLQCETCHNSTAMALTTIVFPSAISNQATSTLGVVASDNVTMLCAQCHQGRESTTSINIKAVGITDDTQISAAGISFVNPHYLGAAATIFGNEAKGWYEYTGKIYTGRNQHGVSAGSCTACHNPHTLVIGDAEVTPQTCGRCHVDEITGLPVANFAQLEESRQLGFEGDIDGDGVIESLKLEIEGLEAKLDAAISAYSINVVGTGACYSEAYPYFMIDTNANGTCDAGETTAFKKFTNRLLKAAFNLKWAHAEPGAWAHNPRYVIEVLFDSITDLNAGLTAAGKTPVAFAGKRSFNGHFGGADAAAPYAAFLYTSGSGFTSKACYQCHGGAASLNLYLADMTGATLSLTNKVTGMQCTTCHAPAANDADMTRIRSNVVQVNFPPQKAAGKFVSVTASAQFNSTSLLCSTCHSGREGKISINDKIGAVTTWTLSFTNPHYLGAAGVLFGSTAGMLAEYPGKTYSGLPVNWGSPHGSPHGANCTGCHKPVESKHTFEVDLAYCNTCHVVAPYGDFRLPPLKNNIAALSSTLFTELQAYANAAGYPLCYNPNSHPYFFKDNGTGGGTAGNGVCEAGESVSSNGAALNPSALRAAFNYKWSQAEPGAYAHNYEYMIEALIDSIQDLNPSATLPLDEKTGLTIVRP